MRVAHFSDIHFGTEQPVVVAALAQRIRELNPDLVIASGDFTMAGRHGEFRAAAEFLDGLGVPVIATPGNHDVPVYNLFERFARPLARFHRYITPRTSASCVSKDVAVLALNTARPWDLSLNWSHGRLSNAQVQRADRFFADHAGANFRALVVHHPFWVPEDLPGFRTIRNGEAMLEVLAHRRVHAALSGHLHRQFRRSRRVRLETDTARDVLLLQVSTVASTRSRKQPNAFSLLHIEDGRLRMVDQVYNGERFEAAPQPAEFSLETLRELHHEPPRDATAPPLERVESRKVMTP